MTLGGGGGAMDGAALRAWLARHGLSQSGGARLFGVRGTTMQRWCMDQREIPPPAVRLCWACDRDPGLVAALRDFAAAVTEAA